VRLWRQQGWLGVGVLDDDAHAATGPIDDLTTVKLASGEVGCETYTLALASDNPLPDPAPVFAMTGLVEVRRWLELYEHQQEVLRSQLTHLQRVEASLAELHALRQRVQDSESELSRMPALEREMQLAERDRQELDAERTRAEVLEADLTEARARAEHSERVLADVTGSLSWRLTSPLRAIKRRAR
jgi:hypothetical protein